MRAFFIRRYGGPEVLGIQSIPKTTPGADEVLVEVRGAAVYPLDWHYLRGEA